MSKYTIRELINTNVRMKKRFDCFLVFLNCSCRKVRPRATFYSALQSTLYTLHSTLYTLHFTFYTLHSTLYTLHSTFYTLHSTLYILHSTLYTLHSTLYNLHSKHFTYTSYFPLLIGRKLPFIYYLVIINVMRNKRIMDVKMSILKN